MKIIDYCLDADLKSVRRFPAALSPYLNAASAAILGLLHYAGTDFGLTSIFLAILFFWYRTVLTRLDMEMKKSES